MPRRERCNGPYAHGNRWRCVLVGSDGTRGYRTFETRAAAEKYKELASSEAQGRTVRDAIEAFIARTIERGRAPMTISNYRHRLEMLMGHMLGRPLRAVLGRGAEMYAAAQPGRQADTHRGALVVGKSWGKWCVRQRWLKENPFADVEPVGQRTLGADKPRLTVDQSRRLQAYCHAHAEDLGAVLTLGYLLLGPRATELTKRKVADLDDDGRLLWIGATKSAAGRRRLIVPDELVPLLIGVAGGRAADDPLFPGQDGRKRDGAIRPLTRSQAHRHVTRVCVAAGVPKLGPQALRRTQATLATEAGESALAVARHLGHATGAAPAVTHRSYVGRDAARDAGIERGLRVIQGGQR